MEGCGSSSRIVSQLDSSLVISYQNFVKGAMLHGKYIRLPTLDMIHIRIRSIKVSVLSKQNIQRQRFESHSPCNYSSFPSLGIQAP